MDYFLIAGFVLGFITGAFAVWAVYFFAENKKAINDVEKHVKDRYTL